MPQPRNKLTTSRRNSGSFVYPDTSGIGVTVGVASTAITTNQTDIFVRGIHHLKSPVEAIVHLQAQGGQGGPGGGHNQGGGGGAGGGGYFRSKIDSVVGKRFVSTVTADVTPAVVTGFWFDSTNYVTFPARGSNGGGGNGDQDPGRCANCPGGGAGSAGPGIARTNASGSLFQITFQQNGNNGSGGGGFHQCDHGGSGPGGAGGQSAFKSIQPDHPLNQTGLGSGGRGGGGTPGPSQQPQSGFVILETPGRPWNMITSGWPIGGYRLS